MWSASHVAPHVAASGTEVESEDDDNPDPELKSESDAFAGLAPAPRTLTRENEPGPPMPEKRSERGPGTAEDVSRWMVMASLAGTGQETRRTQAWNDDAPGPTRAVREASMAEPQIESKACAASSMEGSAPQHRCESAAAAGVESALEFPAPVDDVRGAGTGAEGLQRQEPSTTVRMVCRGVSSQAGSTHLISRHWPHRLEWLVGSEKSETSAFETSLTPGSAREGSEGRPQLSRGFAAEVLVGPMDGKAGEF